MIVHLWKPLCFQSYCRPRLCLYSRRSSRPNAVIMRCPTALSQPGVIPPGGGGGGNPGRLKNGCRLGLARKPFFTRITDMKNSIVRLYEEYLSWTQLYMKICFSNTASWLTKFLCHSMYIICIILLIQYVLSPLRFNLWPPPPLPFVQYLQIPFNPAIYISHFCNILHMFFVIFVQANAKANSICENDLAINISLILIYGGPCPACFYTPLL